MKENIGILDPNGEHPNPLTKQPYSEQYKKLALKWSSLPAYKKANDVIHSIRTSQVTLIISGTGSGKTVLVPKFALHATDYEKNIIVTLPKQIVAKKAAIYSADTLDVELGKEVGYVYKGSDKSAISRNTKLVYATDGTLVAKLMKDPLLSDIQVVVIDEAHERKVQIDFLLYLLKNVLKHRKDFRLVIMSATINEEIFENYYKQLSFKKINVGSQPNHPIESIYYKGKIDEQSYVQVGMDILTDILKHKNDGDVIFFITSVSEAEKVCKYITANFSFVYCQEVYSGMNKQEELYATDPELYKEKGFTRKVLLATSVAESSLTVDGIKYIIDGGFELYGSYDPILNAKKLDRQRITQAQVKQRMGRTGRTGPGVCYHLYSEETFQKMEKYPAPAILKSDITDHILRLLSQDNVQTIQKVTKILNKFIEPPQSLYVNSSIDQLQELKLVDQDKITDLGLLIAKLPISDIQHGICLLYAFRYKMFNDCMKVFNLMNLLKKSMKSLYYNTDNESKKQLRRKLRHKNGDFIALLNIIDKYDEEGKEFCLEYALNCNLLMKAKSSLKEQYPRVFGYFQKIKEDIYTLIPVDHKVNKMKRNKKIQYILFQGYFTNVIQRVNGMYYVKDTPVSISKNNLLTDIDKSKILYQELFLQNNKGEINMVTVLSASILPILD
jgi:pre-mRNA-splicing factor ATP-dependent RNA helicase DHX15/PRP43